MLKPLKFLIFIAVLCIVFETHCVYAQIYKCTDDSGNITYSNIKCPEQVTEETFEPAESYTIDDGIEEPYYESFPESELPQEPEQPATDGRLNIQIAQKEITLHPAEIKRIHTGVNFTYQYFKDVYGLAPNTDIRLKIFGKHRDYMTYQQVLYGKIYSESGVYSPATKEALVNGAKYRDIVVGVSIHESCHALIDPAGYKIPSWLNEGIAEYFETMEFTESLVLFRPQYDRHEEIAKLLKEKELISLLEYFGLSNNVWKNRNLVEDRTSRSIAWSLVHFLMSSPEGTETIKNILNNFKVDDETPSMNIVNKNYPGGLNILEKRWHAFLKTTPAAHSFTPSK